MTLLDAAGTTTLAQQAGGLHRAGRRHRTAVAQQLATALNNVAGFTAGFLGSTVTITHLDGTAFTVVQQHLGQSVQTFSFPATLPVGDTWVLQNATGTATLAGPVAYTVQPGDTAHPGRRPGRRSERRPELHGDRRRHLGDGDSTGFTVALQQPIQVTQTLTIPTAVTTVYLDRIAAGCHRHHDAGRAGGLRGGHHRRPAPAWPPPWPPPWAAPRTSPSRSPAARSS